MHSAEGAGVFATRAACVDSLIPPVHMLMPDGEKAAVRLEQAFAEEEEQEQRDRTQHAHGLHEARPSARGLVHLGEHGTERPHNLHVIDLIGHGEGRGGREAKAPLEQHGDVDHVPAEVVDLVELRVLVVLGDELVLAEAAQGRCGGLDLVHGHDLLAVDARDAVEESDLLGAVVHVGEADEVADELGLEGALDRAGRQRALHRREELLREGHALAEIPLALDARDLPSALHYLPMEACWEAGMHLPLVEHDGVEGPASLVEAVAEVAFHVHLL
mmetsp:Transcript_17320/g.50348  ORF Transcript_17320/g.50348 Transcript_17320/m.50348 type:complete len:274 (+) Transcript_17320:353-1174(+)